MTDYGTIKDFQFLLLPMNSFSDEVINPEKSKSDHSETCKWNIFNDNLLFSNDNFLKVPGGLNPYLCFLNFRITINKVVIKDRRGCIIYSFNLVHFWNLLLTFHTIYSLSHFSSLLLFPHSTFFFTYHRHMTTTLAIVKSRWGITKLHFIFKLQE